MNKQKTQRQMHLQSCLYDDGEMLTEISIMIVQEISPLKLHFLWLVVCVCVCVRAHMMPGSVC